ncbi:MAG TPA: hypothetical protein VF021_06605, partial [Longimicrobiales bacterium]
MPSLADALGFTQDPHTTREQLLRACQILLLDTTGSDEQLRARLTDYLAQYAPSQDVVCLNPNVSSQASSTSAVSTVMSARAPTLSPRKQVATSFLRLAASGQARAAFDAYVADDFRHHNPHFPADAHALAKAMDENAQQNPDKVL